MIVVENVFTLIPIDLEKLLTADFAAAAVLVSMGAVIGKCRWSQLFLLATFELIFYGININLCESHFGAVDLGRSMYVHTFGAYFGFAACIFFHGKEAAKDEKADGSYFSQLVAMVGTLFLFIYWPSFNGCFAAGGVEQQRVIVNTILAISASALTSCFLATVILGKFDMEVMLHATLAGGVAIGTSCNLLTYSIYPLGIGALAGLVSALGYLKINPFCKEKLKIHDTCGV